MKLKKLLSTVAICAIAALPAYATPAKPSQEKIKKAAEEAQKLISDSIPSLGLDKLTSDKVVAKIGKREIKASEVMKNMQSIPKQMQQLPPDLLFLITLDQMVKSIVIENEAMKSKDKFLKDPKVKEKIEQATNAIIAGAYAEQHLESKVTDAVLKESFAKIVEKFPKDSDQADAYEILVDNDKVAKIEEQINLKVDFIKLARDNNPKDYPLKEGHRGFVSILQSRELPAGYDKIFKKEGSNYVVPNGKHFVIKLPDEKHSLIVKVADRKKLEMPKFSAMKPYLAMEKKKEFLDAHNKELMKNTTVEIINPSTGKALPAFDSMMKNLEEKLKGKIDEIQKMASAK